jgi:hypothetical protein
MNHNQRNDAILQHTQHKYAPISRDAFVCCHPWNRWFTLEGNIEVPVVRHDTSALSAKGRKVSWNNASWCCWCLLPLPPIYLREAASQVSENNCYAATSGALGSPVRNAVDAWMYIRVNSLPMARRAVPDAYKGPNPWQLKHKNILRMKEPKIN